MPMMGNYHVRFLRENQGNLVLLLVGVVEKHSLTLEIGQKIGERPLETIPDMPLTSGIFFGICESIPQQCLTIPLFPKTDQPFVKLELSALAFLHGGGVSYF